jgi:hypothetical protein
MPYARIEAFGIVAGVSVRNLVASPVQTQNDKG